MKILLVSGFLGAGKTTFIKALAEHTHKDFAVLENEYGQTGIDGTVLSGNGAVGNVDNLAEGRGVLPDGSSPDKKINIWEMTEGCICCSMKKDFSASVLTLANAVDPEYLVVEPTGVGKPGNIISNVKNILYDRISLLSPVTIVDGNLFDRQISEFQDIYIDQLKAAGTILVSKMESADGDDLKSLEEKLRKYNKDAKIVLHHYSSLKDDEWMAFLQKSFDGKIIESVESSSPDLENIGLSDVKVPSEMFLIVFLESVVRGEYGHIVRAKGYLPCGKEWLKFDVTEGRYAVTEIESQKESRCEFIGRDLNRAKIRKYMPMSMYSKNVFGLRASLER